MAGCLRGCATGSVVDARGAPLRNQTRQTSPCGGVGGVGVLFAPGGRPRPSNLLLLLLLRLCLFYLPAVGDVHVAASGLVCGCCGQMGCESARAAVFLGWGLCVTCGCGARGFGGCWCWCCLCRGALAADRARAPGWRRRMASESACDRGSRLGSLPWWMGFVCEVRSKCVAISHNSSQIRVRDYAYRLCT